MASTDKNIDEIVSRIVSKFDPEKIVLFGSHARGDAGPDSDADLLVVMKVEGSKRKVATEIDLCLYGVNLAVDIVVATPEEAEKYKDLAGTLIHPALKEGKVLYERAA